MPPFRIAARHPDSKHPDRTWFQIGGLYDSADDADNAINEDAYIAPPRSLAADERVVRNAVVQTTEYAGLGYELRVEELVPKGTGTDDAGGEIVTEHAWKAV